MTHLKHLVFNSAQIAATSANSAPFCTLSESKMCLSNGKTLVWAISIAKISQAIGESDYCYLPIHWMLPLHKL